MYIFHRVLSDPYSDVLCSEECQTKKILVYCKMFAFFKAILIIFSGTSLYFILDLSLFSYVILCFYLIYF